MSKITHPAGERDGRIVPGAIRNGQLLSAAPHKWRDLIDPLKITAKRFGFNATDVRFFEVLMSFLPEDHLLLDHSGRLIIFASNKAIAERMAVSGDSTVNRCIRKAEDRALIQRHMSANRKRYRRVGQGGKTTHAYGIDIGPMVAGYMRIKQIADEVQAESNQLDELTYDCRDALAELRQVHEDINDKPSDGIEVIRAFQKRLRRVPSLERITQLINDIKAMITLWMDRLKSQAEPQNLGTNVAQNEQHIDHQENPFDDSTSFGISQDDIQQALPILTAILAEKKSERECLDALDQTAALLGGARRAWSHSLSAMGPERASILLGYVVERSSEIRNPGGYIQKLTGEWLNGQLELSTLVQSLLKSQVQTIFRQDPQL